jgi:hypothetical protein
MDYNLSISLHVTYKSGAQAVYNDVARLYGDSEEMDSDKERWVFNRISRTMGTGIIETFNKGLVIDFAEVSGVHTTFKEISNVEAY